MHYRLQCVKVRLSVEILSGSRLRIIYYVDVKIDHSEDRVVYIWDAQAFYHLRW
jgi:hypothetical protein